MNKKTYTTPFTDIITLTDICQSYTGSVFKEKATQQEMKKANRLEA